MFEQFRRHFPRGSLISELVQIDRGKYIVRASVQNEGLTLATGLAAAETVEQAEDEARSRALAVLEIPATAAPSVSTSPQKPSAHSPPQTVTPESPVSNASPSSIAPSNQATAPSTAETEPVKETNHAPQETVTNGHPQAPEFNSEVRMTDAEESQPVTNGSNQGEETVTDSSDIIARTNVELRRLRWTSEQGRKFLQETYGKRSRTLLSESELLQFLEYLEKQPTPPQE